MVANMCIEDMVRKMLKKDKNGHNFQADRTDNLLQLYKMYAIILADCVVAGTL